MGGAFEVKSRAKMRNEGDHEHEAMARPKGKSVGYREQRAFDNLRRLMSVGI